MTTAQRQTKFRTVYHNMRKRCLNNKDKDYVNYGARGISIDKRWDDLYNFIVDMYPDYDPSLTLDRVDNDKDYSKENCMWVSRSRQQINQRINSRNTSGYKGVTFHKAMKRWRVRLSVEKTEFLVGYYDTAEEGAKAYNKYILDNSLNNTLNKI